MDEHKVLVFGAVGLHTRYLDLFFLFLMYFKISYI